MSINVVRRSHWNSHMVVPGLTSLEHFAIVKMFTIA